MGIFMETVQLLRFVYIIVIIIKYIFHENINSVELRHAIHLAADRAVYRRGVAKIRSVRGPLRLVESGGVRKVRVVAGMAIVRGV